MSESTWTPSTSILRRGLGLIAVTVALSVAAATVARAADLDENQRRRLTALESSTRQIEVQVGLAQDAAGPGDGRPPDAKIRLARVRLAPPAGLLPQVREHWALLPAENADVVALGKRLDTVAAAIASLEARLGSKAPEPSPGANAGAKLDYRQVKELADARFYVDEVTGLSAALDEIGKEVEAAADKDAIDHRRLQTAMNTVDKARQRATLARNRLDALPADGAGVRVERERLTAALVAVAATEAKLKPVHDRLQALVDPARYPTLEADIRRMQELGQMYSDSQRAFAGNGARATVLVSESPEAAAEHARYVKAYGPLVRQQTDAGKRVESAGRFFAESLAAWNAVAAEQRKNLPADLEEGFTALARMAEAAVAERKPAFFMGGVPQRVAHVEGMVALLVALDPAAGALARQRLEKARADLKAQQAALAQQIIDENALPPDAYAGNDRPVAEQEAIAAWKKVQPDAQVLAMRIPSKAWDRETMWRRQNSTWYRIDRSKLQVQLIVRHDDRLAVIRPIDLWIDHQGGDVHSAFPMDDPKAVVESHRLLRLDKVK